jgi:hypothetical protein
MPLTEQDLRESLRRATGAPPHVADRVGAVERRVRRRRTRIVVGAAVVVAIALVAVPLVRWLPDRLSRNEIANSDVTPEQMDAMMKYATFVAYWNGSNLGGPAPEDSGVVGISVSSSLPPFNCTVARPDAGQPRGSQEAWVLATPSVFTEEHANNPIQAAVTTSFVLWPEGVSTCDPPPSGTALAAPYSRDPRNLVGWEVAFSQALADPSRPALDVAAVYDAVPQGRMTDVGRQAYEGYRAAAPTDYGTDGDKLDRVLTAIGQWLAVALSYSPLSPESPAVGPASLTAADPHAGSAVLPQGYQARWDRARGSLCVQGSYGASGVKHVTQADYVDPGSVVTPVDGPCPTS